MGWTRAIEWERMYIAPKMKHAYAGTRQLAAMNVLLQPSNKQTNARSPAWERM